MSQIPDPTSLEVTRTPRFAQFLRNAVAIKSKPVTEVQKYPTVEWFSNMPSNLDEVRSPLFSASWPIDDMRWLTVARVPEPTRPTPPDACTPWLVDVDLDSAAAPPALNADREERTPSGELVRVPPPQALVATWAQYLSQQWMPWSTKAAIARAVKPLYQRLFSAYQEMQGHADAYDLFVGVGLVDSRTESAERLRRHLLAFPAELALDHRTGVISLGPSAEFTSLRPEIDFLSTGDRAKLLPQLHTLKDEFVALGPQLQDRKKISQLVKHLVTSLNAVAEFVDELAPADADRGETRASFAPALIRRPRSTRSLDELLERIEKDTSGETPKVRLDDLSVPWRKMMEDARIWDDNCGLHPEHASSAPERVYFPLPSNEEQSRIVRYASGSAGVVVQGPPGTGKSHTIANLISHFLATGQRVLVTAQTSQALTVLRDKMPPSLQQLCVSLLGDSRASDKDLKRSVDGILNRVAGFDAKVEQRRIAKLEAELIKSETAVNLHSRTLHHARASETEHLEPFPQYIGTKASIARRLRTERTRFEWLTDSIPSSAECPTYAFGWKRLAEYHAALDSGAREMLARECTALPFSGEDAIEALVSIRDAKTRVEGSAPKSALPEPRESIDRAGLVVLEAWLERLHAVEMDATTQDAPWIEELRTQLIRNPVSWRTLRDESSEALAKLSDAVIADIRTVEVSQRTLSEGRRDVSRLDAHYASGGSRRILGVFKPQAVKDTEWIEQAVTIEGLPIRTAEDVGRARKALDGLAFVESAWKVWARWPDSRTGSLRSQVAVLRHRDGLLTRLLDLAGTASKLSEELRQWTDLRLADGCATIEMMECVRHRKAVLDLLEAQRRRDDLAQLLTHAIRTPKVVPAIQALLDALAGESPESVSAALAALGEETTRRDLHACYETFLELVRESAPRLADAITKAEGTQAIGTLLRDFEEGWEHGRARTWLNETLSKDTIEQIQQAAKIERQRTQEILGELTAARAWAAAMQRIDDRRRASLVAWAKAVASIPASGLSVFRKRAVAQQLLGSCLGSIPAWVVSLGRLYETTEAVPGLFDVAIVDEASQCWLDSLVLFYLAKQVIIVGDDKQISPTLVGVNAADIDKLASTYLPDFQYRGSFTLDSSLFDHAQRYLPHGVPLREHFRCVPEIIRFSNEQFYAGSPLVPLRQVGKDRLDPLKRTFLPNGLRIGDINEVEAKAIVEAIAVCHEDKEYEEADFGVMCLQGNDQASRIEQLLVERLGPTVFSQRRLRCGNPYAFQGDERDVMFISMVAAPNAQQQSLTTTMYQQRFNVAMSRARDQAWLFHSIQEDELGANCLRRRVLEFFKQPPDLTIRGTELNVPTLQLLAARADRTIQRPPPPFDSWFEVDVALALAARGLTISAQVKVAQKSIDLVIEGCAGVRLAVECDGEEWHGAEQYEADVARQRQLERADWTFVRVRESIFYSDEERAIREVMECWEEMDVGDREAEHESRSDREVSDTAPAQEGDHRISSTPKDETNDRIVDGNRGQGETSHTIDDDFEADPSTADDDVVATLGEARSGPFTGYASKQFPDPRSASFANVQQAVLDIITADGPLPKESLFRLYRDGCPRVEKAGKIFKQAVNRAVYSLERAKQVVMQDEGHRRLSAEVILRLPSQDPSAVRPAGARRLEDVPLAELASMLRAIRDGGNPTSGFAQQSRYREVGRAFGLQRMKQPAVERLRRAEVLR